MVAVVVEVNSDGCSRLGLVRVLSTHRGQSNGVHIPSSAAVADSALGEDVGGGTIGRRLCRKRNIEPFLAKSLIIIDIADSDELLVAEAVCSHHRGKTITPVAPYLVAAVGCLCFIGVDWAELAPIKSEYDELAEKIWLLEKERRKFNERYLVLFGEKTVDEAQVATLDGEVNRLSQQVQDLAMEKTTLVERLALRGMDHVVENNEFALGIRGVKAGYVAAGVERGKQTVQVLSSGSGFGPSEPGVIAQPTDAMHAVVRAFAETDFASYLKLGELGLVDLCQLCSEEEDIVPDDDVEGSM
ncbi:unnamed protein product [Lactuca saligna]|uniref:Uncharacterized protein n=1 Tax=Lactuca saligna TaxID=75948 RepID=A0AA35V6E7_LACSI|nr:unnamed protein product [Lactuca saligna]